MEVLAPTGYPSFSIFGKLVTYIPVKDLAYRLNLLSAIFGALTILFLFLALNIFVKNEIIALAGSLTYAFTYSFWTIANRFELDAINCFYMSLTLFASFLYSERKNRKYLCFAFFCLGLSLTDHPIALFIMPAFLLYIIIIKPAIFKSLKAVLLSILFFIIPLSLYAFIPIRSLQGYGPVKSLRDFFYYITGRYTTGSIHGGNFGDKDFANFLKVSKEFFLIIYQNFGLILIIIGFAGLIYLLKKNIKFAACSLFIILLNLIIITQYIGWAPQNQILNSKIVIAVYITYGFLLIFDAFKFFLSRFDTKKFKKSGITYGAETETGLEIKKHAKIKNMRYIRYFSLTILLVLFLASPAVLAVKNYGSADDSEPEQIYLFWNEIFNTVENNSFIYSATVSQNIAMYINLHEQSDKNIKLITNREIGYSAENIKENLQQGEKVYLAGIEDFLIPHFNLEKIDSYYWDRFNENLIVYRITGEKLQLEIEPVIPEPDIRFGDIFEVEYIIKNSHDKDLIITSIELSIPKNLKFVEVESRGYIKQQPGLSDGKYMWVKDYIVEAGSKINIILKLRAQIPGQAEVKFSITSQNIYMDSPDVLLDIRN